MGDEVVETLVFPNRRSNFETLREEMEQGKFKNVLQTAIDDDNTKKGIIPNDNDGESEGQPETKNMSNFKALREYYQPKKEGEGNLEPLRDIDDDTENSDDTDKWDPDKHKFEMMNEKKVPRNAWKPLVSTIEEEDDEEEEKQQEENDWMSKQEIVARYDTKVCWFIHETLKDKIFAPQNEEFRGVSKDSWVYQTKLWLCGLSNLWLGGLLVGCLSVGAIMIGMGSQYNLIPLIAIGAIMLVVFVILCYLRFYGNGHLEYILISTENEPKQEKPLLLSPRWKPDHLYVIFANNIEGEGDSFLMYKLNKWEEDKRFFSITHKLPVNRTNLNVINIEEQKICVWEMLQNKKQD